MTNLGINDDLASIPLGEGGRGVTPLEFCFRGNSVATTKFPWNFVAKKMGVINKFYCTCMYVAV